METMEMHPIAHMRSDFPTKFGIPRQSGLVEELRSMIVFEPEYRSEDALRGIEDFSHLWLIWQFSQAVREGWSPTVRPPRLGGNTGTPIFDIKPYIPYSDSRPEAAGGFTDRVGDFLLKVDFPQELLKKLPPDKQAAAIGVLSHDPRPSYQNQPGRVYGLSFGGFDIRFTVEEETLTVLNVEPL